MKLHDYLSGLDACGEALEWAGKRGCSQSAWRSVERGDWLLWLAVTIGIDRKLIVLAACDCAELSLVYVPKGEERPRQAIVTARAWASGVKGVTLADVRSATDAAYAVSDAAAYATAAYAAAYAAATTTAATAYAYAAAYAAADATADATAAAADAADAYAAAADAADARSDTLRQCALLVRKRIPWPLWEASLKKKAST